MSTRTYNIFDIDDMLERVVSGVQAKVVLEESHLKDDYKSEGKVKGAIQDVVDAVLKVHPESDSKIVSKMIWNQEDTMDIEKMLTTKDWDRHTKNAIRYGYKLLREKGLIESNKSRFTTESKYDSIQNIVHTLVSKYKDAYQDILIDVLYAVKSYQDLLSMIKTSDYNPDTKNALRDGYAKLKELGLKESVPKFDDEEDYGQKDSVAYKLFKSSYEDCSDKEKKEVFNYINKHNLESVDNLIDKVVDGITPSKIIEGHKTNKGYRSYSGNGNNLTSKLPEKVDEMLNDIAQEYHMITYGDIMKLDWDKLSSEDKHYLISSVDDYMDTDLDDSDLKHIVNNLVKVIKKYVKESVDEELDNISEGVIKKIGDNWRIRSAKTGKLWTQKYRSKKSAESALKAYHASKH